MGVRSRRSAGIIISAVHRRNFAAPGKNLGMKKLPGS